MTLITLGFIASCTPRHTSAPGLSGPSAVDLGRLASAPTTRPISARTKDEITDAAQAAAGLAATGLKGARGLRYLQISAIPYLRRSPEGAAFLGQSFPRAIARGAPADHCPAAAASPIGAATTAAAAEAALTACFSQLAERSAQPDCGCRMLAADGVLFAPQRDFTFATGVAAFLIRGRGDETRRIIAESQPDGGGGELVALRDANGLVGVLRLRGGAAELRLADQPETIWRGAREPFGYRRGRLAERLRLTSEDGAVLRVLIGVERRDALAAR